MVDVIIPTTTPGPISFSGNLTLENTYGPMFANVKDEQFAGGAKGDMTTDDTAAIQAAVDAVEAAALNATGSDIGKYIYGGTIYFPPSNKGYKISSTINIPSTIFGLRLTGPALIKNFTTVGDNSRIFRMYSKIDDFPANNHRGFVVDGFAFDWDGGSSDGVAFYFDNQIATSDLVQLGVIQNCYMREGKHFIQQHETGGTYISSLAIRDCIVQNISSSAVRMILNQVGCTALTIDNMWTQSSTADPTIDLAAFHSFNIYGCSFEAFPGAQHAPTFRFNNCQGACAFHNNRTEWGEAGGKSIIQVNSGASAVHVRDVEFRHHEVATGTTVTLIDAPNIGTKVMLSGLVVFEQAVYDGSNTLNLFDVGANATAIYDGYYINQNGTGSPTLNTKVGAGTLIDRTV